MIFVTALLLLQLLIPAAAYSVHTGFNYGAFWGTPERPKRKWDYASAFTTAYNLNTSVAFDSARLFTCRQPGTTDTWIEAFDAAVQTHTYLLLGFYLSETKKSAQKPGQTYESNIDMLKYELQALEKALGHYGYKLADLIIGLSVGNEDMEQWYAQQDAGVPENVIADNIATIRNIVLGAAWFSEAEKFPNIVKYMTDKPIGHTDTVLYAAKVKNVNFVGMNAYPYWSNDPPAVAKTSYFGSIDAVKKAIPGKEIWLTEVGWPYSDSVSRVASQRIASKDNLQKYWNEIGCSVFGKYTTFWFELLQDTLPDQPDWAIIDASKHNAAPRIDVSCGIGRKNRAPKRRAIPSPTLATAAVASASDSTQATSRPTVSHEIYTGFSYGAFWPDSKAKHYEDFVGHFTLARNLPNVPVPFTSARLYQAAQWNLPTEPSEAFQAAIDTNTTLLVGLWLPIEDELQALDKAFEKYGQKLTDLVIGIAVGNEDIYRGSEECTQKEGQPCDMTATADEVIANITYVKEWIQKKPWYKLFKIPPPIGHVDTARNAIFKSADFVGANIFPFWHTDPIDKAWDSFEESLQGIKERAGDVPVWITETGWPSAGNDTTASLTNMQKYWSIVGCSLLGKYTTFWFELEKDTLDLGNLDWGLIDTPSQIPKINDLSCPGQPNPPSLPSPTESPTSNSTMPTSTAMKNSTYVALSSTRLPDGLSIQTVHLATSVTPSPFVFYNETSQPASRGNSTIHVTVTSTITLEPSHNSETPLPGQEDTVTVTSYPTVYKTVHLTSSSLAPTEISTPMQPAPVTSKPTILVTDPTGCITIYRDADGQKVTTSNPPVNGKCPVPTYAAPSSAHATAPAVVSKADPTRCVVVVTDPAGKLITMTTDIPGKCVASTPTPSVVQETSTTLKPTVFVTEATGCITVSEDSNGQMVTVASNPPVGGKCATPTYMAPPTSKEEKSTAYLSSSSISNASTSFRLPSSAPVSTAIVLPTSSLPDVVSPSKTPFPPKRACKKRRRSVHQVGNLGT